MADQPLPQISWSASLRVAHPSRAASKGLHGDKILLPQSALEQLLAAAPITAVPSNHTFTAFDPFNPYSVAAAQNERHLYRETTQHLPNPLMFRLANPASGNIVHAGIREFSADEGEVALSPYLLDALGISESQIKDIPRRDEVIDLTGEKEEVEEDEQQGAKQEEGNTGVVNITVTARQLPKGSYVRLRPLEAGYNPDDWKSLLERQLRASFTTLTKDAILSVRGVKGEEFRFLADKFLPEGDGICVVDTDLEVDIEALNEEQARETLRQIAAKMQTSPGTTGGSSIGHPVDIWKPVQGQVLEGDYVDYVLPSWDRSRPMSIELTLEDANGEVDLLVSPKSTRQRALPRETEHVFADLSSPKDGVKTIIIQPTNVALEGAESLQISVHGFALPESGSTSGQNPRRYNLRVKMLDLQGSSDLPIDLSSSPAHAKDESQCKNCLQWVPTRTKVLHENFCLRNNILCPHCHSVFQKSSPGWANHWHCPDHPSASGSTPLSKTKHEYLDHTAHPCLNCDAQFAFPSVSLLAQHRTTNCPSKLILCHFCHLEVPQEGDPLDPASEAETVLTGLTPHERADGARTTDCHLCGAIVRLRDMPAHTAHHDLDKAARHPPAVCRNALCGRTLHGMGPRGEVDAGLRRGNVPGNDLGLCSLCFGPLYVSMHDPEGKALRRRVERRYLAQVMTGCGKKHCLNSFCRTGRGNLGLESQGSGTAVAMPVVKPLLEEVGDKALPMHFCVDEGSQRRKKVAEMLAAEGGWDLAWCVAAGEAESGDVGRMREWLANWAPVKTQGRR